MLIGLIAGALVVVGDGLRQAAARTVKIAGEGVEAEHGPVVLEAVDLVGPGAEDSWMAGRAAGGVNPGCLRDIIRVQTGDFAHPVQVELLHLGGLVLLEAVGVLLNIPCPASRCR